VLDQWGPVLKTAIMKFSKRHFWEWFSRHNQEYLSLGKKPKKEVSYCLNELTAHLRACNKFIGFGLDGKNDKQATLIITVDGKARHFKKVEDLVAMAPSIAGWEFVALEVPRPIDFLLGREIEKSGIDPRELKFTLETGYRGFTLRIYHPLCTEKNEDAIYELAHGAVYNLLGERSFGLDIGFIDVMNLSYASRNVKELEALPGEIDRGMSGMRVDDRGNLRSTR
jgi:hypothetical protein